MKKLFFALISFAMLGTSCTKTENVEPANYGSVALVKSSTNAESKDPKTRPLTAMDAMEAYADGYQHGWGNKNSLPAITIEDFKLEFYFNGEMHGTAKPPEFYNLNVTTGHTADPNPVGQNHGYVIVWLNTYKLGWMWTDQGGTNIAYNMENYMNQHYSGSWYDTLARIGYYDGFSSGTGKDYRNQITLDGVLYVFPWPTDCPGCEPF